MEKIDSNKGIREEQLQSRLDTELMNYISSMISYVLNPQDKLPPNLKENNLGFIFASNLLNLSAKPDFVSGVINVDKQSVLDTYNEVQDIMNEEFKPENNLTYYPLYMIKPSNSSKFIHGLPYVEILDKWYNEFDRDSNKLTAFIEKFRNKLHIDTDIEILSAKVVGRSIHLRIKNDIFDVTIPLGYSTKHETFSNDNGETIELNDCYGNIFSPQGVEKINYYLTDEELKQNVEKAHKNGAKYMMNYFAWRAPEYVIIDNYKYYYHSEVADDLTDDDAIKHYDGVLHHFENGKRVVIKQVNDRDGNFLSSTQDQILPDYGKNKGNELEKEKYNYWKNTYKNELVRLVNLGIDGFRIDLAHGFRKNNDCDLLYSLISEMIKYADEKFNKKLFFVLETYDFSNYGGTTPATFRDWNNDFAYPAVKVYHKETEDKFTNAKGYKGLEHLIEDLHWLFQDIRGINGEMMAASTFDDFTLYDIAEKSGIDYRHILEMEMLLGKAGYNILSLDRDFLGENGEMIPTVPGGRETEYGTGKFITHSLSSKDEFNKRIEYNSKNIYTDSDSVQILRKIDNYGEIIGISIDKNDKKLIFNFADNSKRIFDFNLLINKGSPYTESPQEQPKYLSETTSNNLLKLEQMEKTLKKELQFFMVNNVSTKKQIPNTYNYKFWLEFKNYVKLACWNERKIEEWDSYKQEAYFKLHRERLIRSFLIYKNIDTTELNNIELSIDTTILRKQLQIEVENILKKSIERYYPDLVN